MRLFHYPIQNITRDLLGSQLRHVVCLMPVSSVFIPPQYHADSGGSFEIVLQQGDGEGGALMQMSPLYPSKTDWVADYDPITSLGDANWTVPQLAEHTSLLVGRAHVMQTTTNNNCKLSFMHDFIRCVALKLRCRPSMFLFVCKLLPLPPHLPLSTLV